VIDLKRQPGRIGGGRIAPVERRVEQAAEAAGWWEQVEGKLGEAWETKAGMLERAIRVAQPGRSHGCARVGAQKVYEGSETARLDARVGVEDEHGEGLVLLEQQPQAAVIASAHAAVVGFQHGCARELLAQHGH
jgi:hypothetical protein